jgi:hypothetical protein
MRLSRSRAKLGLGALLGVALIGTATASAGEYVRNLTSGGTTAIRGGAPGSATYAFPEWAGPKTGGQPKTARVAKGTAAASVSTINRRMTTAFGTGSPVRNTAVSASGAGTLLSFRGLNHYDTRTANNGNQFSGEPPDQGLCVGNGFVLETVNQVLRVFDRTGHPLTNPTSLNEFYKYPPAINRTTGKFGPFVFDPTCHYDAGVNRWFHVAATLQQNRNTGAFTGNGWLDLAVSKTGNPLGAWTRYRIFTTNNGTHGQPDHNCQGGPCFGDYPHIGADAHGFYITTNEYAFNADQFTSAQIYALSKAQLAAGLPNPRLVHIDNTSVDGTPGFTVWPAISSGNHDLRRNGTEWFLSNMAAEEANGDGSDNRIGVWGLSNTASLNAPHPNLVLKSTVVHVNTYSTPPPATQKPGPTPLRACLNNTALPTPFGPGCWQYFFLPADEPAHNERIYALDSLDSRMQQVMFADGKLWGAHGTAVGGAGNTRAGIAFYVIGPSFSGAQVHGDLLKQARLAVAGAHVTMPAVGVLPNGKGAMAFTLNGPSHYPSGAWAPISASGIGAVRISGPGVGPADGFSGYKAFGDPPRPRWGDYGAAAVDDGTIWLASEYIAQKCALGQYVRDTPASPQFTCFNTRTAFANWATRITQVSP